VTRQGPISTGPLQLVELGEPEPGPGQVRVRVRACGVCRTDLHLCEGDLPPRSSPLVPGHQVVGVVEALGPEARRFVVGERVGVAWLGSTCSTCHYCLSGRENLCERPVFTGWDTQGGFAEAMCADERFCYRLPEGFDDLAAAPLLCAGIIGYRALKLAGLPPGGRLGLYGFGASAHLCAQLALGQGAELHVVTRSDKDKELARRLGASWVGGPQEAPPVQLDSAILFAPAGELVPLAMAALARGGTLAIAGIHLSEIPPLDYQGHLFYEKQLRSVTANTRQDGEELLGLAGRLRLEVTSHPYPFEMAPQALLDLAERRFEGAAVLEVAQ